MLEEKARSKVHGGMVSGQFSNPLNNGNKVPKQQY